MMLLGWGLASLVVALAACGHVLDPMAASEVDALAEG